MASAMGAGINSHSSQSQFLIKSPVANVMEDKNASLPPELSLRFWPLMVDTFVVAFAACKNDVCASSFLCIFLVIDGHSLIFSLNCADARRDARRNHNRAQRHKDRMSLILSRKIGPIQAQTFPTTTCQLL
jgi:hypothetical protein